MSNPPVSELAPTGILRAAINLSNFLLVSGRSENGDPEGVAPDLAACIADDLGVDVVYLTFKSPGELADAVLAHGIYVIGFSYPVVPKGQARIRVQLSAAHTEAHIDQAVAAFTTVGREMGIVS